MMHKVAASLAPRNTYAALHALNQIAPLIGMAEIRLDLMESFDLPRLRSESPCPLIITCRPRREGGQFAGSEQQRLAILRQAIELECAYVDVEWDCIGAFADYRNAKTQIIVSRHWFDHMPMTLGETYLELAPHADVVKLVGLARQPRDILPALALLHNAISPVIALVMGEAGRIIRLIGPCFSSCLLTYGAVSSAEATAPGQLSVAEMIERYHLNAVGPHTAVRLHLCASAATAQVVIDQNKQVQPGEALYLPLVVGVEQAREVAAGFRSFVPNLTIMADPPLDAALWQAQRN